jgi:8-oxo-dGTP pyrophosphatase MutT (NUDIX family)
MAKAKAKARAKAKSKTKAKPRKKPVRRPAARRTLPRTPRHRQYAVIPVRFGRSGQLQIMLLTSRGTGRWVIPKGWPMPERTPAGTAEREAFEEAGVKGYLLSRRPIGSYRYLKVDEKFTGAILVRVFILAVVEQKKDWPESRERRTRWFPAGRAASLVQERELARLLKAVPKLVVERKAGKKP